MRNRQQSKLCMRAQWVLICKYFEAGIWSLLRLRELFSARIGKQGSPGCNSSCKHWYALTPPHCFAFINQRGSVCGNLAMLAAGATTRTVAVSQVTADELPLKGNGEPSQLVVLHQSVEQIEE